MQQLLRSLALALVSLIVVSAAMAQKQDDWTAPSKKAASQNGSNEKIVVDQKNNLVIDDIPGTNWYVFSEQDVKAGATINGHAVKAGDKIPVEPVAPSSKRCDITNQKCSDDPHASGAFCGSDEDCTGNIHKACSAETGVNACVVGGRGHGCYDHNDCGPRDLRCDSMTNSCRPGGDGPVCKTLDAKCNTTGKYCSFSGGIPSCVESNSPAKNSWLNCSSVADCRQVKTCNMSIVRNTSCGVGSANDSRYNALCNSDDDCKANLFCDWHTCKRGFFRSKFDKQCSWDSDCDDERFKYCDVSTPRSNSYSKCVSGVVSGVSCVADDGCPTPVPVTPIPTPAPAVSPTATAVPSGGSSPR